MDRVTSSAFESHAPSRDNLGLQSSLRATNRNVVSDDFSLREQLELKEEQVY